MTVPAHDHKLDLNPQVYERLARWFERIRHLLGLNIKLHHEKGQVEAGDIFLFNHFARMETFIPQYLIYQACGAYCRSVAAGQFFHGNESLAKLLIDVGAVPNDHPHLLALLAANVLRGRKVVVFPEGGMVKDRRVIDSAGEYSIYSRKARVRRKHHTGAARLAIGLEIFHRAVLRQDQHGNREILQQWADAAGLESRYALVEAARRPVAIIPANITFYPLRIQENLLVRGVELFKGNLSERALEELIVEGNLLLKRTDMDIRLGDPLMPFHDARWWEKPLVDHLGRRVQSLEHAFETHRESQPRDLRYCAMGLKSSIERLRDDYMEEMYRSVTVNLSHLAAHIIFNHREDGHRSLPLPQLRMALYLFIKQLHVHREVHLHRDLCNPEVYARLLTTTTPQLQQLLESAARAELLAMNGDTIEFLPKLTSGQEFDEVRLENPLEVYANEVEPLGALITDARPYINQAPLVTPRALADLRFNDQMLALAWDKQLFSRPRHAEINQQETATMSHEPFLLVAPRQRRIGVLLIHGLLASPAEVRGIGEKLHAMGYTVHGPRLKGHGTSPWDLRERRWEDWLASVREGYQVLQAITDEVALVGFSTGGALGLLLAAEAPSQLAGVGTVCTGLKFRNQNLKFAPLVHGANNIVRWLTSYEGVFPFRFNESEHPHINYRNVPIRALYELTQLNDHLRKVLSRIACPVTLVQSTGDPVVDPASANLLFDQLSNQDKRLYWVEAERHGILCEDIGDTHQHVFDFLARLEAQPPENA